MSRIEEALEKASRKRKEPVGEDGQGSKPAPAHAAAAVDYDVQPHNPYLVMLNGQNSPVAEEYKKLKSMVVKLTRLEQFRNTIMVTSALRDEGKSITSLNLAITLAQEYDNTVLLVDTDLRRPSVHEYLGLGATKGLSDCLMNGTDVSKVLVRTNIEKLVVLPAGKAARNPVELLMSGKMKSLVKELKQRYSDRYVIFDTPPVLPFAEVHSLAAQMDGVLFVIREGHASRNSIKGALEMLKGTNILGSVYNCASMSRFDGYQYYYGYGGYGYKGDKGKDGN